MQVNTSWETLVAWQLTLLGTVVILTVALAYDQLKLRLDQAARERQLLMDAVAHIEALTSWQTYYQDMDDAKRERLRVYVEQKINERKFS
jgi:hypothetical protein